MGNQRRRSTLSLDPKAGTFNLVASTVGDVAAGGDGVWVIDSFKRYSFASTQAGKNLSRSQAFSKFLASDPEPVSLELVPRARLYVVRPGRKYEPRNRALPAQGPFR